MAQCAMTVRGIHHRLISLAFKARCGTAPVMRGIHDRLLSLALRGKPLFSPGHERNPWPSNPLYPLRRRSGLVPVVRGIHHHLISFAF